MASRPAMVLLEPRFALVANSQDQDSIGGRIVAVKRNVARASARDQQFAEIGLDRTTDKRVIPQ